MRQSDIWQEMRRHLADMKETLDGAMRKVPPLSRLVQGEYPPVNIYETAEELIVDAGVPGVKREDLAVSLKAGKLTVSGRHEADEPAGGECRCKERVGGEFSRDISLPAQVDEEAEPVASLQDGVLSVRLRKKVQEAARAIEVEVR